MVVLRHRMSESGCVETRCQKVVVVRQDVKLVIARRGIESGYGETGCQ